MKKDDCDQPGLNSKISCSLSVLNASRLQQCGEGTVSQSFKGQHGYGDFSVLSRLAFLQKCHQRVISVMHLFEIPWKAVVGEEEKEGKYFERRAHHNLNAQTNFKQSWRPHRQVLKVWRVESLDGQIYFY